jgi:hypothetical protein
MRGVLIAILLTAFASIGPAVAADDTCPGPEQGFQRVKFDHFKIVYRWVPTELKVGQFFAVEVVDCTVSAVGPAERIAIDATMPVHGHGMNYRPTAERIAAGHYRFTGLMLHMPGTWRFTFRLITGDIGIILEQDVDLKR